MKITWETIDTRDLAAIIISRLKENGIDAVLVGGACITIYSLNRFLSYDLDFVSHGRRKDIAKALGGLGFAQKDSRQFVRDGCPFSISAVSLCALRQKSGKVPLTNMVTIYKMLP